MILFITCNVIKKDLCLVNRQNSDSKSDEKCLQLFTFIFYK